MPNIPADPEYRPIGPGGAAVSVLNSALDAAPTIINAIAGIVERQRAFQAQLDQAQYVSDINKGKGALAVAVNTWKTNNVGNMDYDNLGGSFQEYINTTIQDTIFPSLKSDRAKNELSPYFQETISKELLGVVSDAQSKQAKKMESQYTVGYSQLVSDYKNPDAIDNLAQHIFSNRDAGIIDGDKAGKDFVDGVKQMRESMIYNKARTVPNGYDSMILSLSDEKNGDDWLSIKIGDQVIMFDQDDRERIMQNLRQERDEKEALIKRKTEEADKNAFYKGLSMVDNYKLTLSGIYNLREDGLQWDNESKLRNMLEAQEKAALSASDEQLKQWKDKSAQRIKDIETDLSVRIATNAEPVDVLQEELNRQAEILGADTFNSLTAKNHARKNDAILNDITTTIFNEKDLKEMGMTTPQILDVMNRYTEAFLKDKWKSPTELNDKSWANDTVLATERAESALAPYKQKLIKDTIGRGMKVGEKGDETSLDAYERLNMYINTGYRDWTADERQMLEGNIVNLYDKEGRYWFDKEKPGGAKMLKGSDGLQRLDGYPIIVDENGTQWVMVVENNDHKFYRYPYYVEKWKKKDTGEIVGKDIATGQWKVITSELSSAYERYGTQ